MLFSKIEGREGEIRIDSIGATIGQINRWTLSKETRGEEGEATGLYVFRAEMRYINQALMDDPDYEATVYVVTHRDAKTKQKKQYRLEQAEGRVTQLRGRSLLMEGVRLCQPRS